MTKVGINGFGRIGQLVFRASVKRDDLEVVAINDLIDAEYMAYMLKYNFVHERFDGAAGIQDDMLVVNGHGIHVTAKKEPQLISWGVANIEYVAESIGRSLIKGLSQRRIEAGAKYVVMSAPLRDGTPIFVTGANLEKHVRSTQFASNASRATNCLAPLVKVFNDNFGVEQGLMTTAYAVMATQKTVNGPSLEGQCGGRSATGNVIPSSTGAAKTVGKVIPELNGKLTGVPFHVSTMDISVVGLTVQFKCGVSYNEICAAMKKASEANLKGIMECYDELLVSQDSVSDPHTSIFDAKAGAALTGIFVKIVAWYDSEWSYSNKVLCLIAHIAEINRQPR